jgi:hypothetical protein
VELERRDGSARRILRAGDLVTIVGKRGLFKIQAFRGDEVDVYGGPPNREGLHTFKVERVGRRPRRKETRAG